MLKLIDSITNMIFGMMLLIIILCINVQFNDTNDEASQSKNRDTIDVERIKNTNEPIRESEAFSPTDLWDYKHRILIPNIVDYDTAVNEIELPKYVTQEMKEAILKYVYNTMKYGKSSNCAIIGMSDDEPDNGITAHFIFNEYHYICVWFNKKTQRYITIYDKIKDGLTEYSEELIM